MRLAEFIQRFPTGFHRGGNGSYKALCPAHVDKIPSLSISEKDGKILLRCHAGCETPAIVAALGLRMSDLFADTTTDGNPARRIAATYPYHDEQGGLLFEVVRYEPKGFRQRRPDANGEWLWNLDGTRRVLYGLPEVLKAKSILVVEGEKDVQTARKLGLAATCNPGGAGKWRPEYSETIRSKGAAIICDADSPGLAHGREVARSLIGVAESVRLIEALPAAKDLAEWVEKGGTRDALLEIIRETPALTAEGAKWRPAKAGGFTLTPLCELLARPDAPVDYLLDGCLVVGTVSGVFAKPKVGKGTLARNLCLAVSRGEDFLGLTTKQGECVYLALEERAQDIKRDFRAMGADGTEPILIHAAAAPAEGMKALCELVRERKPRLVVIDPIIRLARIKDERAYAETYAALGPLIDVARETGTHVMFLHHSGKSAKTDVVDSPLGTTAIGGVPATLIVLKRTESYRTIQTVQRTGEETPETVLQFNRETKRLSIGGTRDQAETEKLSGEILELLQAAGEWKTEPYITDAVEGKTKFVRRALRQLVEQGKVSREGEGKRGDPYRYRFSFSCSRYIPGTREQETQKPAGTRINAGPNLVPNLEQKPFLVPESLQPEKPADLTPENSPARWEI
jgi:putative DNA primase/helicase